MAQKTFVRNSNIRDFRVDQGAAAPAHPNGVQDTQQNIKNRQSLVTEWTQSQESIDAMWESWNEEQRQAPAAPAARTPPQSAQVDLSQRSTPAAARATTVNRSPLPQNPSAPVTAEGSTVSASSPDLPWAAQLANDERRLEKAGAVDLSNAFGRQEILKIRTREFAQNLQKLFREQIDLFNECRRSASHSIHVYKVAGAPDDFMLFRNGLKLLVSAQRAGKVQFAFNQYIGQLHAPSHQSMVEIDASWGAFDQLIWTYRGERVQIQDIVRYFLSEFSRQSFR